MDTDSAFHIKGSGGRSRLYVEIPCEKCGEPRRVAKHNNVPGLCRRCSYESRGLGAPSKLPCSGSDPYSTLPLDRRPHADGCPREEWVSRKRIKSKTTPGHRTEECRRVVNQIRQRETLTRKYLKDAAEAFSASPESSKYFEGLTHRSLGKKDGFSPTQRAPRIQSDERLAKLEKICNELSDEAKRRGFQLKVFDPLNPHRFQPGHKTVVGRRRENSDSQRIGLLVQYAKRETFSEPKKRLRKGEHTKVAGNIVKGLCQFCRKLVLSAHVGRASKAHAKCYQEYSGNQYRKGLPPEAPEPWRPTELESLRKHYSWAIRHKLGEESLGDIAKQFDVAKQSVAEAIDYIITHLPAPELVNKKFRDRISRLLAST